MTYSYDRRVANEYVLSYEDAQGSIEDFIHTFKDYLKRSHGRPELFRKIGDLLEEPEISKKAVQAEKRIEDVTALLLIAETADKHLEVLHDEYHELFEAWVAARSLTEVSEEAVYNLPHFGKTRDLAEASRKITFRLRREEAVDWSLEEHIGETGLYKEISHREPRDPELEEALDLSRTLFGALDTLTEDLMDLVKGAIEDERTQ